MNGAIWVSVILLLAALALPLASLRGRNLPGRTLAMMAAAWIAIFIIVAVIFAVLTRNTDQMHHYT